MNNDEANAVFIGDERRQNIYIGLAEYNAVLAGLYRTAIRSFKTPAYIGEERARIATIGNSMREVMNALASVIGDNSQTKHQDGAEKFVRKLPEKLAMFPEFNPKQDNELIPLPREIALFISELSILASHEEGNIREDVAALLAEGSGKDHPVVRQWMDAREEFVGYTHYGRPPVESSVSDEEIEKNIQVVEDLIERRLQSFFDSRHSVESLLNVINMQEEDRDMAHKAPTKDEVEQVLRRISTLQLRRVFYYGNKNPLWVRPLLDAGAFINPPEPIVDDKGLIREQPWPEIDYLKDMAPQVPNAVVDVILAVKDSTNSWIRRSVFEIGAAIPAYQAALIVPVIKGWVGVNTGLGFRSDPRSQALMVRNLLDNNQYKAGMQLAAILLEPRPGNGRTKIITGLEEYWYAQELPEIIKSMGQKGIGPVCRWLLKYERLDDRLSDKSDSTFMDRSIIDQADANHVDIRQALIDGLLSLSIKNIENIPEQAILFLLKRKAIIIMRIALHASNQVLRKFVKDHQDTAEVIAAARELLGDAVCTDSKCRVEYAQLVQTIHTIDPSALNELPAIVTAGPFGDPSVFKDKLKKDVEEGKTIDEKLIERTEYWRHRLLAAIGSDSLPKNLQDDLRTLDEKLGIIAEPLSPFMSVSTSWVGPTSPVSKDDFTVMSAEEIVSHLEIWKPKDSWNSPSHEGQAREITGLLTTNPMMISGVDDLINRLRPTYLSAIFRGWEAAIKTDIVPDWQQLVRTAAAVLAHSDESSFVQEGRDFDDEPNYKNAKQSAEGMLEDLARKRDGLKIPEDIMESIASLILNTDTEDAWRDYIESASTSNMDPLTISINYRWPTHLRAIIMLLTHGNGTPWYSKALATLNRELARDDTIGASRAILGERLGNLSYFAPEWLASHKEEILGTESSISTSQQLTLTTILATSGYYNDVFDLIRPPLLAATKQINSIVPGWEADAKPNQLVGRWVVLAFIWGHIDYDDDALRSFYTNASPETRGYVIGRIAWTFVRADKVVPKLISRLGELWDLRVSHVKEHLEDKDELNDFFWFIRSGKYAPEWWLPRLIEAAKLHGDLNTQGMIGEILAGAAKDHPRDSLDALKLLLIADPDDDGMRYDLTEHAAPATIAAGLMSSDISLTKDAKDYMNKLGAGGYINLESRVNILIAGSGGSVSSSSDIS